MCRFTLQCIHDLVTEMQIAFGGTFNVRVFDG